MHEIGHGSTATENVVPQDGVHSRHVRGGIRQRVMCAHQPETGFRETVLGLCRAKGFKPRVAHGASSTAAMAELVAAGVGVALVPQSAADRAHAGVAYRSLAGAPLELSVAAVWRSEAMTPMLRTFLDHAVKAAKARPAEVDQRDG